MKKLFRSIALSTIALAVIAGNAMAYQITLDVSGERTQSRNATQGNVKAAYYNPAGLVNLPEGIHVDVGNRILYSKTTVENAAGKEAVSETWTTLLPNAAAVWRVGSGALFITFDICEAGGGGSWLNDPEAMGVLKPATPGLTGSEGTAYTFGTTLGGAARLNNMLAIYGGVRYLQETRYTVYEGPSVNNATLAEFENTSAYGWQGVAGIMITPMESINITFHYVSETLKTGEKQSKFRNATETFEPYTSWSPNVIAVGLGYTVTPGVEIQISYNYTIEGSMSYGGQTKYESGNGGTSVYGLGAEYKVMDMLTVSFGMSYLDDSSHPTKMSDPTDPTFDTVIFGAGVVVTPMPGLNIDLGMSYHIFWESNYEVAGADFYTYNRDAFVMGIGVSYAVSL